MDKQRYEYYKGSTAIIDNETDEYVEDVVDVLNQKDFNINELLKIKQLQRKQITDLEAKLAESENRVIELSNGCREIEKIKDDKIKEVRACWMKRYDQLKQQLAEKEKFLERIMSGEYIPANIAEKSLKLSNQTAIAELEKVKKLFEEKYAYDVEESDFAVIYETDIDEIIDQQINNLRSK